MNIKALSRRFGRRGAWLIILGLVWIVFGFGVFLEPYHPHSWVIVEHLPPAVHAALWMVTGLVAVVAGLRGPYVQDATGHVALYLMPAIRVLSYAISWVLWVITSTLADMGSGFPVIGWHKGWYAALVWAFVSIMLRLIADWPNPTKPIPFPPPGARSDDA